MRISVKKVFFWSMLYVLLDTYLLPTWWISGLVCLILIFLWEALKERSQYKESILPAILSTRYDYYVILFEPPREPVEEVGNSKKVIDITQYRNSGKIRKTQD